MRINNIVFVNANACEYIGSDILDELSRSIRCINRLFKFNSMVSLEFIHSAHFDLCDMSSYIDAEAVAVNRSIYIFTDKIKGDSLVELIAHEYVHVCIESTFISRCPLWLNEGLAMFLSGQHQKIEPSRPIDIEQFYTSTHTTAFFYNMAIFVVLKLLGKISLLNLIAQARNCRAFAEDSLLGTEQIKALITSDMES